MTAAETFEIHASLVGTDLAALDEEEQARFAARTATSHAQQDEAERRRTEYAGRAVSAKYKLRYLRRDLLDDGAIPPDLSPALHDVDPPDWAHETTTEERP